MRSSVCYGKSKVRPTGKDCLQCLVYIRVEKSENRDEVTVKMRYMDQISGDEHRAHE